MSRYDNVEIDQLTDDELLAIPLHHQWYRTSRFVRVCRAEKLDVRLFERFGGDDSKRGPSTRWVRGWYRMTHGETVWINAATADVWLTELDSHLWVMGRPDLLSAVVPEIENPTPAQLKARADASRRRKAKRAAARMAREATTTEIGVAA